MILRPTPQREEDLPLMKIFYEVGVREGDLLAINRCRIYQKSITSQTLLQMEHRSYNPYLIIEAQNLLMDLSGQPKAIHQPDNGSYGKRHYNNTL
jgi:hypothetical protein